MLEVKNDELEEKKKELEEATSNDKKDDIIGLKSYISDLEHEIQVSSQSIKRLQLEILQHRLFDAKDRVKILEDTNLNERGERVSKKSAKSLIQTYNEEIDHCNREIKEIGEVESAEPGKVSEGDHRENQLLHQIEELTGKIASVKADIKKLELRQKENSFFRATAMEKHKELDLDEERRRLYIDMRNRAKFIKEKEALIEEIREKVSNTKLGKKEKVAIDKKKDDL